MEDGKLAAQEIIEWTKPRLSSTDPAVLDWGCGPGRIVRHIPALFPDAVVYGCDINESIIEWNKLHYRNITFSAINNFTPTLYAPSFFDLIYGISIFTHIGSGEQEAWIKELHRILKNNGILLVSTQGDFYQHKLFPLQKSTLRKKGIFTQSYPKKGHRMMSTYHTESFFRNLLDPYFSVLEYYNGKKHPSKMGGQDLWILQKKPARQVRS